MTTPTAIAAHAAATGMDTLTARRSLESRALAQRLSVRPRFVDYTERFGE